MPQGRSLVSREVHIHANSKWALACRWTAPVPMSPERKENTKLVQQKIHPIRNRFLVGSFVFLHLEHVQLAEATQKLVPNAHGPYKEASIDYTTVTVKIQITFERVSCEKFVTCPVVFIGTLYFVGDLEPNHGHHGPRSTVEVSNSIYIVSPEIFTSEFVK